MAYIDDFNAFAANNPGDAYQSPNAGGQPPGGSPDASMGDPLLAGVDPGTAAAAPAYSGLAGDPFQTALVTSAQLAALQPPARPRRRPSPPQPYAGLSSYLGA